MPTRIVIFVLLAAALAGCGGGTANRFGADLFTPASSHCHGSDLGGGIGPPLGAGSDAASLTDEQIDGVIRIGPGAMPGFGRKLTDTQIASLVDYLRSRQNA